jgi:hypothetical protein
MIAVTFKDPTGQVITRRARQHRGWLSVYWRGKRYQLFGGTRTPFFINPARPIRGRWGAERRDTLTPT